jgi:hypothetical protein
MRFDNLTICYQGIQRVYRNAIVNYVRDQFVAAFGTQAADEVKKPFKKEWDCIEAAARQLRETGKLSAPLKDAFDILGVNHFHSLFDAYFDLLCPSKASAVDKDRKSAKHAILSWLKDIKDFRDPLSHPAEVDFDEDDSRHMLRCARKTLDFLQLPKAAREILELQKELEASAPARVLVAYLPPADEVVLDFVGRERELRRLQDWLDEPYVARWALAGDGGKGKSAIAYAFARQVAMSGHPNVEAVVWLSAKLRRFVAGATMVVDRPDFSDLDSALDAILRAYGSHVPNEKAAKKEEVLELLKGIPALIVVDDIDTLVTPTGDVVPFLLMDVPAKTPSKVLVTSRKILVGCESFTSQVSGFAENDARDFIELGVTRIPLMLAG